jgi:hypothetical protein
MSRFTVLDDDTAHAGAHDPHMASQRSDAEELGIGGAVGLVILASLLFWPRLFILGFAIFDRDIGRAFDSWLIPFAGFFLLPWTTVAYAAMWSISSERVSGVEWAFVGFAFLLDAWAWSAFRR